MKEGKVENFLGKNQLAGISLSLIAFILLGLSVAIFKVPSILKADNAIGGFISFFRTYQGIQIWSGITFLGNKETIIAFSILLIIAFFLLKKYTHIIILTTTVIGAELSGLLAKNLFQRIRPVTALPDTSFSFPSGHATISMAFYGLLIYFVWKNIESKYLRVGLIAVLSLLILSIGFSRLYLGMHFLTDILDGYFLGFAWIILGVSAGKTFLKNINKCNV